MTVNTHPPKAAVLYVDDDLENLESFKAVFRRDYTVHLARSAQEALDFLERTDIQVLITDQRMPEMSGSELLATVADRYPDMLRFMLTGFSDFDPLVTAINDGRLQGYFSKPLDVKRVKGRIENGLAAYYLTIENQHLYESLKDSEQQIRQQLAELEQIYTTAPVGLFLLDENLRIVRVNQRLARITGRPLDAHPGKTLQEVVPELAEELTRTYRSIIETGRPAVNLEISGVTAKAPGVRRNWIGNYFPYKNHEGQIVGVMGGVIEITDMRLAEKEAQAARFFSENLLKTANAMIVVLDQDGCIQLVNPALEKLTGYRSEELVGQNWFERIVPRKSYPQIWEEYTRLKRDGIAVVYEHPVCTKDGCEKIISWSNSLMQVNGVATGTLSVGIDITQRKMVELEKDRLATQLRQAQKMEAIGTLAGGIAHDFNNILSPIIGYAEIIIGDPEATSDIGERARAILGAGLRARDLTHQILTFSREKEQEKMPIKIQPVIKEALKLLRASLPSTIALNQRIDDRCGPIMGDATQIYQVIMNLCTNAFQALHNNEGRIEVVVEQISLGKEDQPQFIELQPGPFIRVSVSDTGPGIDPDIMERIFDPYFTTKRMKSGTGLGLSVVHGIVKSHGGAIKVYSECDQGTTFNVFLPRLVDDSIADALLPEQEAVSGGNESILLVDDEKDLVDVVKHALELLGYRVTGFTEPLDALKNFKANPRSYDLVLSDMTMPHLNGLQFAKAIKENNSNQRIVICTGFSDMINRISASEAGIQAIVLKPIISGELAKTVRKVLDGVG